MQSDELITKLEAIATPKVPLLLHQHKLKLSILSATRSARMSLILMAVPFVILLGAVSQSAFNILLPPWSWIVKFSPVMPQWVKIFIYVTVLIVLPLTTAFINLLAVCWFEYDKQQKMINISIRVNTINIIILIATALIGLLFIGNSVAEWLTGTD